MPPGRIVGSDIAHAVPLTLLAGAGHWYLGTIDWRLLLTLLIGSLPGIIVGSYLSRSRAGRRGASCAGCCPHHRRRQAARLIETAQASWSSFSGAKFWQGTIRLVYLIH